MGRYGLEKRFECRNDCKQSGCPGHVAKLEYNSTVDCVNIYVDGNLRHVFDEACWVALLELDGDIGRMFHS